MTPARDPAKDEPPTIDDVRAFWDAQPLWTGESRHSPMSRAFFEEHRSVYYRDCFAGAPDDRIFPSLPPDAAVLDLGCGVGFWTVEFWTRGFRNLHAADLSPKSLEIARRRCEVYGVSASFSVQNAQATGFERARFDHVNCQGVIHHTPSPGAVVEEIAALLRPGGTASISVYYRNVLIRNWRFFRPVARLLARAGARLKGRGREDIFRQGDVDDIVRRYDGKDNPIGLAYTRAEFEALLAPWFEVEDVYFHFFPARSLPFPIPAFLHRFLDGRLPFMIYASLRKRGDAKPGSGD